MLSPSKAANTSNPLLNACLMYFFKTKATCLSSYTWLIKTRFFDIACG